MSDDELIWRIAGGSGDGIDSTSQNFAKALMRAGLHVFTTRLRTVDEVNCRTRKARVRSIEIEILEIKSTNRARTRARFPE
ncbi:hypothetical protein EL22_28910 [Halostagnicola sp. A56]|uniref:2-oxoacid:acceptor oxidoreductase family protein n=1 Tax=Halostagnicola sp. A56 TaxID=1495067 RepID=UPI00065F6B01|nr:2-oxoacid:acceptor oxidoreductase family protein [Halostagnicola sp. A56]KMT45623.1 hypothetical protein EL22_28910 [Halostagnicola sp. A56]